LSTQFQENVPSVAREWKTSSEQSPAFLPIEVFEIANFAAVRLRCNIDESFQPDDVDIKSKFVVFELRFVERVTSFGIRGWVRMIRRLQEEKRTLFFFNCPVQIVNQFNMIAGFGGNGQIVSFHAPYFCDSCDAERDVLVDLMRDHDKVAAFEVPKAPCPFCGDDMNFDEIPRSFFAYVASRPPPDFPPSGTEFCRRLDIVSGRGLGNALRVRKAISNEVTLVRLSGHIDADISRRAFEGLEGEVVLELREVEDVRGEGPKKLSRALKRAKKSASGLWLVGAAPILTLKMGSEEDLAEFRPNVASIHAPYRCDQCDCMVRVELWLREHWSALTSGEAPVVKCEVCDGPLFPQFGSEHLAFLTDKPPPVLSPAGMEAAFDSDRFLQEASLETSFHTSSLYRDDAQKDAISKVGPGTTLGKYQLESVLGVGGMAEVFLARNVGPEGFEKEVVIKRILPHLARETDFVDQFVDEARLTAQFNHPNIAQIFELVKEPEEIFIAMEFVDGEELGTIISRCRKLGTFIPIPIAIRFAYDLLQALHYAHEFKDRKGNPLGVVHRDVSPNNILITGNGIVKLVDFGIAQAVSKIHSTLPGKIKGKIPYMAPEQLKGIAPDRRVDVYSAGVVLFEMLTLTRLWQGDSNGAIIYAVVNKAPPKPSTVRDTIDAELDMIMKRALAKKRADRFSSAEVFANVLSDYCIKKFVSLPGPTVLSAWLQELSDLYSVEIDVTDPAQVVEEQDADFDLKTIENPMEFPPEEVERSQRFVSPLAEGEVSRPFDNPFTPESARTSPGKSPQYRQKVKPRRPK